MKLTSKQFLTKAEYYKSHPYLSYIVSKGYDVYECTAVYGDGSKSHLYLSTLCLPISDNLISVFLKKLNYSDIYTELTFFKTFLMSCNLVQLRHFCAKVFELYRDLYDICFPFIHYLSELIDPKLYTDLISQLSTFAGDKFTSYYIEHYGKK